MSFQILQRAYAPYGTAAQFPASGDSRLIYRATDTGYLYTWDASESAYKLAGIDPTTAPYLGLHAQADDAAKLGGQLPSYYAQAGHVHNYAGSSTPGGAATTALACTGNAATAASCTGNSATATTASSCSGNAATATKLATARLINGTSFNGSSDVIVSKIYDANYSRIVNPDGGTLLTTGTRTGAIAIRLPVGMTDTMVHITIKVYEYLSGHSFECHVAGYNYPQDNTWAYAPTAYIVGNPNVSRQLTVRFGCDSVLDKTIIYIGELNSVWAYPQVYVTEVLCGFLGYGEVWASGWQIDFEASAFKNVTATITDCQVGYRPQNAFTGAKVIGGTTYNFVNGLLVS